MITFYRGCPDTVPPMPADKSALSTLPLQAYQHCEAVRVASGLGWYIFPPRGACLRLSGSEILIEGEEGFAPLSSAFLGPSFSAHWNALAPAHLQNQEIAWLTAMNTPRILQIWSGFFVSTKPGWQLWVKPLTNVFKSQAIVGFEGVVRTDQFKPAPLFANFQIQHSDRDIHIDPNFPMFQVVALPVGVETAQQAEVISIADDPDAFDWEGYERTSRGAREDYTVGRYGAQIRKAARKETPPGAG